MIYTTIQGDMWDAVAYKTCGSTDYTDKIMRLNTQHIGTYIFPAGVELNIPDLDDTSAGSTLPPWKVAAG